MIPSLKRSEKSGIGSQNDSIMIRYALWPTTWNCRKNIETGCSNLCKHLSRLIHRPPESISGLHSRSSSHLAGAHKVDESALDIQAAELNLDRVADLDS